MSDFWFRVQGLRFVNGGAAGEGMVRRWVRDWVASKIYPTSSCVAPLDQD